MKEIGNLQAAKEERNAHGRQILERQLRNNGTQGGVDLLRFPSWSRTFYLNLLVMKG